MHSLRWIWGYLSHYWRRLCAGLLMALIVSALNMVNPYLAGKIIDKVILGNENHLLWIFLCIMIVGTLVRTMVRYSYQMVFEGLSQNVIFMMREHMYNRLHHLDFSFYDQTKTGDIMSKMTGDLEAVRHFTAWTIYMIFENATILLFAIGFMFYIHPPLALTLLIVTPVIGYFAFRLTIDVKPTFTEIRNQFAKLNSVVQENISGNRIVKAFAKENYEIKKFSIENDRFKEKNLQSSKIWEKYLPILDSFGGVLTVLMIFIGGLMVIKGTLTFGELVMFNSLIWAISNPMKMAGWLLNDVQRFIASAEKIEDLLKMKSKILNINQPVTAKMTGMVEFHHVFFSYGEETVLKDIHFSVKTGETVGIIGPTGAGKSSLVNLISRFYDADAGEILLDGINVKKWDIQRLRNGIATVMQDIFLFSDTIEGNIAYGNPEASLAAVQNAAKMADAHNFISKLPEGYDTVVGERGVGLSGGQRQRIALARALLKDPAILILDDTTSSLDMETEHRIQNTLKSLQKRKTNFIIAHRISSVKDADIILVMNNGKIMERGTHKELLKKKGYYFDVYMNQYGNFENKQIGEEVI
ncbi:ABC transporter ATP-binding protein [Niallia sp. NCCP-28]|uniref:ABC transporter ATP-binding protein n=1 Tax=Niallia sp. NCCP-28 TaxID=2934712 RepID=UPI00208765C1|nr:ABC transporter ATP-binding protein [Niallia sp. NCCP-28]GKU83278.1 ABC transporter ATP-binding protein [Niallia sp. NCCP-28]